MYATVTDMIARFGETQIIRLSQPEDRTAATVDEEKVNIALADASAVIDGYIRGRYFVPISVPPAEIVRATCILARYDLSDTERSSPTEEMSKGRADVIKWLESISKELVNLDVPRALVTGTDQVGSGPRISDRGRVFSQHTLRGF